MKKIFNGTPHAINIVVGSVFSPELRKYVGGDIVKSIPSNGMLNAKITTVEGGEIDGIPTFEKKFTGVDVLPEEEYDIYIVSALYSAAAQKEGVDLSKIYTVADPVYTGDGLTVVGCRGIAPAF